MILLELAINKQIIIPKINREVISDSVGFLYIKINLDEDWTGLKTKIVIYSETDSADILIPEDMLVAIPPNFLKPDVKLKFTISGYSEDGDKILHTKEMLSTVNIFRAGQYIGGDPEQYQPNLWEQAIAQINSAVETANSVKEQADNGDFVGPKGEQGPQGMEGPEGPQGEKGENGEDYILTEADKQEIADIVLANFTDVSEVGQ